MIERTAKRLADAFEPTLEQKKWGRRTRLNLQCESEDEAVLVAHELQRRGWKASYEKALGGSWEQPRPVDVVVVKGRKAQVGYARVSAESNKRGEPT